MNILLELAFLFFIGSVIGWVIELFFRRFTPANKERKWTNPGFCTGPYLPIYGCGLCVLYIIASLERFSVIENPIINKLLLFALMTLLMTVIEYIAGVISLKVNNIRLWDYSNEWANLNGIICPKFSFFWGVLGAVYYFLVHPYITDSLDWLSRNLAFSFFIGAFYGVFTIDLVHSLQLVSKLKKYAAENNVILRYENIKMHIRKSYENSTSKYKFFRPFYSEKPLYEHLKEISFEKIRTKKKK